MLSTTHLRRQVKAECDVPQVASKTYARFKMGNNSHNAMLKQTEHWSDLGAAYFVHAESIICSVCAVTSCGTVDALTKSRPPILQRLKLQYQALYGLVWKQKGRRTTEHNESTLAMLGQCAGNERTVDNEQAGSQALILSLSVHSVVLERHLTARL